MIEISHKRRFQSVMNSLAVKVGAFSILLIAVVLAVFSVTFILAESKKTTDDILKDGQTFAAFTVQPIYDNYVQFYTHPQPSDFQTFKERMRTILKNNTDIKEVDLVAQNGRILFRSNELSEGKYSGPSRVVTDETTLDAVRSDTISVHDVSVNDERLTEIVMPLTETGGGHILSARYLLSYSSRAVRMQDTYRRTAVVSTGLLVVAVGVAIGFANRQTRPVRRLTHVAEEIQSGNFDVRAEYHSKDELGRLADALNVMAGKLKGFYLDLEDKVKARTHELEMTQAKLQANVRRDEALLASIGDGVIATDRDGAIVLINDAAIGMLKISRNDVMALQVSQLWQLETEAGVPVKDEDRPVNRAMASGKPIRDRDHYCVRRNAEGEAIVRFPVVVNVSPVMLNGKIMGTINVFSDVTHEHQVDRMKTEFISLASHQLRTPLSAIRWFSEMLVSGDAGKLNPEQQEFAQSVYDSTDRMIQLVSSLLNISRIESGRIIIDPKPTDLNELVQGVVNDVQTKLAGNGQTLHIDVHKDLPKINLDPQLIGQVYMNFLTNAIKYTPKGGSISISISQKDGMLVSKISDNGYGIPAAQQKLVFQKFFRAQNVVKVETDGTGLGLYLVKAIIESSGGTVSFESEEGKGTTFRFSLPMSGMKAKEGEVTLD